MNNPFIKFKLSGLVKSFNLFSKRDQSKVWRLLVFQMLLGFMDLVGVGLIGVLGALSVRGVQSERPGDRVSSILRLLHIDSMVFQSQVALLGAIACTILITRTALSIYFTRKTLKFLSGKSAELSEDLFSRILNSSLISIQKQTTTQLLYSVTTGVEVIAIKIIGTIVTVLADAFLLVLLILGLFVVDKTVTILTVILFGLTGLILYFQNNIKARKIGRDTATLEIVSNTIFLEPLNAFREVFVRNTRSKYLHEYGETRRNLAHIQAESAYLPYVSKYVLETTVIVGGLTIAGIQFLFLDATHAIATLSVFLAAGSRITPALLRIQQGLVQMKTSLGNSEVTLDLIYNLKKSMNMESYLPIKQSEKPFNPEVDIDGLIFSFANESSFSINIPKMTFHPGDMVALVGPSGSGKSTLVDLILGIHSPSSGSITISGEAPSDAIRMWNGRIGYVPQNVFITQDSIYRNVILGLDEELYPKEYVRTLINDVSLGDFIDSLDRGIDSLAGERGATLSGGQKQRIGIARALITTPSLLILDEATSSLDGVTESEITNSIVSLKGKTTLVVIAHRLSTIRNADVVLYFDKGMIVAQGTFEEVRALVPDFDKQAEIMGI
jgi:ABC-type multidrug transport system fused ATPase/permease subunit